jgi:hypothetical protein
MSRRMSDPASQLFVVNVAAGGEELAPIVVLEAALTVVLEVTPIVVLKAVLTVVLEVTPIVVLEPALMVAASLAVLPEEPIL